MDNAKLKEIQNINNYFYEKYEVIKIDYVALLSSVLFNRIKIVTIVWVLGLTFLSIPVVFGFAAYYGFSLGFILSISTMSYGMLGIVIGMTFLLPQYILYTPAIVYLMNTSLGVSKKLYFNKLGGRSVDKVTKKQMLIEYVLIFFIVLFIVVLGCLLETFVNPKWVMFSIKKLI
jgi:stage II sporulation protein M